MERSEQNTRESDGFITVLVTGGRKYKNQRKVFDVLNELHLTQGPIGLVVNGGASGADQTSTYWSKLHGIPVHVYPAKWEEEGKSAGPIRNARMLKEEKVDIVVAFPGSKGTADLVRKAKKLEITTWEVIDDTGTGVQPTARR